MVELLPSKQNVASSSLVSRSIFIGRELRQVVEGLISWVTSGLRIENSQTSVDRPCGSVVEHSLGKGEVARSIRAMGTNIFNRTAGIELRSLPFSEKLKWQKANSSARSRTST